MIACVDGSSVCPLRPGFYKIVTYFAEAEKEYFCNSEAEIRLLPELPRPVTKVIYFLTSGFTISLLKDYNKTGAAADAREEKPMYARPELSAGVGSPAAAGMPAS